MLAGKPFGTEQVYLSQVSFLSHSELFVLFGIKLIFLTGLRFWLLSISGCNINGVRICGDFGEFVKRVFSFGKTC